MERKIKIEKTVDLATAECQIFARYWEDSEINGVEDDANNPKMPCVESVEHFYYGKKKLAWCPIIDLDNGRILNWSQGNVAKIHYKSCDENVVVIKDRNGEVVKDYTGYVPRFLDHCREGFGDYVIMEIDYNGYIRDFDNGLDDIFGDEKYKPKDYLNNMGRILRFRGKNIHTGEWLYGDYHREGKTHYITKPEQYLREYAPIEFIVDEKTVGQFTELFDKTGKNIFEGDILQCPSVPNIPLEVRYNTRQGAFCLVEHTHTEGALLGTCPLGEMLRHYPDMSIIGNRFDNPELISDKQ